MTPLQRATQALKFYADPANWQRPCLEAFSLTPIAKDGGKRAKRALRLLGKDHGQLTLNEEADR